jgi:hypothetical protein
MNSEQHIIEISYTMNEREDGCDYIQVTAPDQEVLDSDAAYFDEDGEDEALGCALELQREYAKMGREVKIVNRCK